MTPSGRVMLALALALPGSVEPTLASETLPLNSELRLVVRDGRDVELAVRTADGESLEALAVRVTGRASQVEAIRIWNGSGRVKPGDWVRVPLALLNDDLRALVLRSLFPQDRHEGDDWIHVSRRAALPLYDEGLWQVAQWFTGRGDRFAELMRINQIRSPELAPGQAVRIPASLLHPAFGKRERSDDGQLEYDVDGSGPFASYRLRPGEALYSAVVMRFTGRTGSEDVVSVAAQLAARNAIRDTRDIPVGFEIKIPLDLLEPEFLPRKHPRREQAEARRLELAQALEAEPIVDTPRGLEGVVIVLDPGHGGRDLGTMKHGIWEHDYVYDVTCRLKWMLERETSATVYLTLEDSETGCMPSQSDRLAANHQGSILTDPPFLARKEGEAAIGVNLRWYLSNSIYRRSLARGVDTDRIVFISLHADSRHPSLRGTMVYVPGAGYRAKTYGHNSGTYNRFAEVREKRFVSFSHKQRVRSEAVSRKLGLALLKGLRRQSIPIQPYQPMRDKVIRGKQRWVPAVLRSNAVPTKVLVEMLNLSNPEDAALLASAEKRQRLARGLLDGLYTHFGESPGRVASSSAAP